MLYGTPWQQIHLSALVNEFASLWENNNTFTKTPNGEEISIPLVEDWELKYKPGQARVYLVGREDCELIDKVFNELHEQGCLQ